MTHKIKVGSTIKSKTGRRFKITKVRRAMYSLEYMLHVEYEPKLLVPMEDHWRTYSDVQAQVDRKFWTITNLPTGLLEFRRHET